MTVVVWNNIRTTDRAERYQHLIDEMLTETTVGSFDDISLHDL